MSTSKAVDPGTAVYLEHLTIQLRLLEVPGELIGQIRAEVETHVADTGQAPVDAFGEPGEYAARYAETCAAQAQRSRERGWLSELGIAGVGASAGTAAFEGVLHLAGSVDLTARTLGTWLATAAVGMIVVHVLFALLARETAGSAKPRAFTSRYLVTGVLAWMVAVGVLVLVGLLPAGPTLLTAPGWVLLVVGGLALSGLVRHLSGDRVVDPRE